MYLFQIILISTNILVGQSNVRFSCATDKLRNTLYYILTSTDN